MSAADENEADLRTQESLCCVGVTAKRQKKTQRQKDDDAEEAGEPGAVWGQQPAD